MIQHCLKGSDKYEVLQLTLQFFSICKFPLNQERVTPRKAINVSTWVWQQEKLLQTNPLWIQRKTNILLQLSGCALKQTQVSPVGVFLLHTAQNRHPWVSKAENLWTNLTVHFQTSCFRKVQKPMKSWAVEHECTPEWWQMMNPKCVLWKEKSL